ncbi:hypothetical protein BJY04DRAFT_214049 [Aspergillus karnatakaensis]|uniref:uncharacterized protein n=1 Tax=Aspergillus karnatakaensis TaxID=1810916 RepID=UPI003CCCB11C
MSSPNLWISILIEHCLSSYDAAGEANHVANMSWEDDGSNLRFPDTTKRHALINSWEVRNDIQIANLTDSSTQIDAYLSLESLKAYNETHPTRPLSKDACRGYTIQLSDFEVVYEYLTAKPKVHLYVKRFSIVWERGKQKRPPAGKSVAKKHDLATLVKRVFSSIQSRGRPNKKTDSSSADSNGYGDIPASQILNDQYDDLAQAQLMTQMPKHSSNHSKPGFKRGTVPSVELLGHLKQTNAADHSLSQDISTQARLPDHDSIPRAARSRSLSRLSTNGNERHNLAEAQRELTPVNNINLPVDKSPSAHTRSAQPSPQNVKGKVISRTSTGSRSLESAADGSQSSYSPDKQLEANLQASQGVMLKLNDAESSTSSDVDPWADLTGIRSIDVTVPKDQEELLNAVKKPWYPPPVGEPRVSGHVPPALLNEWNNIVASRNQTDGTRSESPEESRTTDLGPSTPTTESSSDDEGASEEELTDWEVSPDRNGSRVALPADSSPIKGPSAPLNSRRMSPSLMEANAKNPGSAPREETVSHHAVYEAVQANGLPNTVEIPEITSYAEGHKDNGSDDTSSDVEMEIAIPQPQSGSTQQEVSSQVEPRISSSGLPLPDPAIRNVQVVETPAAALNRTRPVVESKDILGQGCNAEIPSQPDKSSSQSRILNTYSTNEGDSRESKSQESSKSIIVARLDSNQIHIMGTPYSSEPFPTQPTPWSGSNSMSNSSGLKSIETDVPATSTYQSQSSKAFSSYRDMPPSSILSIEEEQKRPSVKSSPRCSSSMPTLKRSASELEADSEHDSPSKRTKVEWEATVHENRTGLDAQIIIARKQTFLIDSAQSVQASHIYDKFCGKYPSYGGDFAHFIRLCSQLQSFRESGNLRRSFLWDDFIIKNLEDYPQYLAECLADASKPLKYEEYFVAFYSKPTHNKRVLDEEHISACAAQFITIDEITPDISSGPMTDAKTSFTESLRDQLDNLHTYSFAASQGPLSQDRASSVQRSHADLDSDFQYSIPDSEPGRVAAQDNESLLDYNTAQETAVAEVSVPGDNDEEMEDVDDTTHETASVELGDDEPAAITPSAVRVVVAKPANKTIITAPALESPASDADIDSDDMDEFENEKDKGDQDGSGKGRPGSESDKKHEDDYEPAIQDHEEEEIQNSIETQDSLQNELLPDKPQSQVQAQEQLQDEPQSTPQHTPPERPQANTNTQTTLSTQSSHDPNLIVDIEEPEDHEPESINENWFRSLRHIYPPPSATPNPVWSEDPHTPFKKWARADQDVLRVRYRRGGAHIPVDEKGVIQPVRRNNFK